MTPKTIRENIISLQGHITGIKRDVANIKNNHLKHMQIVFSFNLYFFI